MLEIGTEQKIIHMPDLNHTLDTRGLGHVFFSKMWLNRDKIAQIDGLTGDTDTYGSLLQRCIRTAITIRSKGITPDHIVALCTPSHFNSCVPFIATLFVGAKTCCLDPTQSLSETVHLLKQMVPKIIFVAPEALKIIQEALKQIPEVVEIVVFGQNGSFSIFLQPNDKESNFKPIEVTNDRDTAMIFCTSGSSGLPKGICINHFHFLSQLMNAISFGFCFDIALNFSALHWVSSVFCLGATILTGSTRVIVPNFDVNTIWDVIEKCKPTLICSAPSQVYTMARTSRPKHLNIGTIKHLWIGGAPIVEKHILTIRKAFPNANVFAGYGQTETGMIITVMKPNDSNDCTAALNKPTSCGRGIPGMQYKIINPDTKEVLGPNQPGELRLKSELLLNGYYNLDSSDLWDADGWYKTGDVLYYDEDRYFYVVDRIKEVFKFQGRYVTPTVLEEVLSTHPSIANSVVIGLPHDEDDNHAMAIVVLNESANGVTAQEIEKYVEERVDDPKRLRGGVKIVEKIPTTAIGKVVRRHIRAMVLRGEL